MIKCCIFDLDGTLIDSLADLAQTVNHLRLQEQLSPYPTEAYRLMVGDGVVMLLKRAFPTMNEEGICRLKTQFDELYKAQCLKNTRPYPDIEEVVQELKKRSILSAVLTNKPEPFARKICSHFFDADVFAEVVGQRENCLKKPAPDGVFSIMKKWGCKKEEVLFVGDSDVDIFTAKNAGVAACGVLWGFRSKKELADAGADFLITTPRELLPLIECL